MEWSNLTIFQMGWNHHLDWIFTISTGDRRISEPSIVSRGASSKVTLGERWANFNFEGSWLKCPKLFKRLGKCGNYLYPAQLGIPIFRWAYFFRWVGERNHQAAIFFASFFFLGRVNLPRNQETGGAGNSKAAKKGVFGARDDHRDGQVLKIFTVEED